MRADVSDDAARGARARAGSIGSPAEARERDDFYPTPSWCTEALLDAVAIDGLTWEPACGDGAIMDVFRARGLPVVGSDLIDRGTGFGGVDFLFMDPTVYLDGARPVNIVTNPPFKHAPAFAARALGLVPGKVAMLVKWNWLVAEGVHDGDVRRRQLLQDPRCCRVVVLGRASMLPPGAEDKGHSGQVDFCWLVWDQAHRAGLGDVLTWAKQGPRR